MASGEVVDVLVRLGQAVVAVPANLPGIERELEGLQNVKGVVGFCREVVAVMAGGCGVTDVVCRQAAGMVAKQIVERNGAAVQNDEAVRQGLLAAVMDPTHQISNAACGIISIIPGAWPSLLPILLHTLSTNGPTSGLFTSLSTILEGCGHDLNICCIFTSALEDILRASSTVLSPEAVYLLKLIYEIPELHADEERKIVTAQEANAETYGRLLLSVPDQRIILESLAGFVQFWGVLKDVSIVKSMFEVGLAALQKGTDEERIAAAGFWGECAGHDHQLLLRLGFAQQVMVELVMCLQYRDEILADKPALTNSNDSHIPDEERALIFYGNVHAEEADDEPAPKHTCSLADEGSLRAEAHLAIMIIAEEVPQIVTETILPMLARIGECDWRLQEAILTSLSASASGSELQTINQATAIIPQLIQIANTSQFGLVRSSALTAITELLHIWVDATAEEEDSEDGEGGSHTPNHVMNGGQHHHRAKPDLVGVLHEAVKCLTQHLADPNKKAQKAAIEGITQLYIPMEKISEDSENRCIHSILDVACAGGTQAANRMSVFEKVAFMVRESTSFEDPEELTLKKLISYIQRVAAEVGTEAFVRRPEAASVLWGVMQTVIEKDPESDPGILDPVVEICGSVVETVMKLVQSGQDGGMGAAITSIDVISSIADNIPEYFQVKSGQTLSLLSCSMMLLKSYHLTHAESGLQTCQHLIHSLASLTGDIVSNCHSSIAPHLPTLTAFFCKDVLSGNPGSIKCDLSCIEGSQAVSNVFWALSEIVGKTADLQTAFQDGEMVDGLVKHVLRVAGRTDISDGMHQNACCLLGVLIGKAKVSDEEMLGVIPSWLPSVASLQPGGEKQACILSLTKFTNPYLLLSAGVLATAWRQTDPSTLPKIFTPGIFSQTASLSPPANPLYKLALIFVFHNLRSTGSLSFPEINTLFTSSQPVTPLNEASWKALCKTYACSPSSGFNRPRLAQIYQSKMRDIDTDFRAMVMKVAEF
eukprot:TRINITY_DN23581_c1_g1_i1.p1 TRINITY_DN23581_c1_g1~~TRINITY_DN23581_c1_g1_i1.p1  ORF type:complete len:993 (+),score=143.40 TRINITY_DN23581_c1_g1_i1:126-3104(+)